MDGLHGGILIISMNHLACLKYFNVQRCPTIINSFFSNLKGDLCNFIYNRTFNQLVDACV